MPWDVIWPQESVAYIRVTPKSWEGLEDDETVSEYTYIYEDRIVHIWESNVYEHPDQEEEDEIARARIIWERLNPAADWFYCHTDGTRIGDGEAIPHHAHIIIGLRDEVDPDWWHRAMRGMKESETITPTSHWTEDESEDEESTPNTDSEFAQPECLAPARLDQHGATAQVDGDKDAHPDEDPDTMQRQETFTEEKSVLSTDPEFAQPECLAPAKLFQPGATAQVDGDKDAHSDEDSDITQGKSASCTADECLRSELSALRSSVPNTFHAFISFWRQSVQMFFSPKNAIADFQRRVKELWNIPKKHYYLLFNGVHDSIPPKSWSNNTLVQVKIKGLLGGSPIRYRYATRFDGKRTKGSGPVIQTAKEIAEKLKIPPHGLRVNHGGHVLPLSATLKDIFGEEDNGTFDFEKGRCHEIIIEHPKGIWKGFGKGEQTFAELVSLKWWDLDDGDLLREDGEEFQTSELIRDVANWESPTQFRWMENEEKALDRGMSWWENDTDSFSDLLNVTFIHGFEELKWEGRADTPISQIQDENWFASDEKTA
jgi:hypothetical protein